MARLEALVTEAATPQQLRPESAAQTESTAQIRSAA
jgi:hypothetical protein